MFIKQKQKKKNKKNMEQTKQLSLVVSIYPNEPIIPIIIGFSLLPMSYIREEKMICNHLETEPNNPKVLEYILKEKSPGIIEKLPWEEIKKIISTCTKITTTIISCETVCQTTCYVKQIEQKHTTETIFYRFCKKN